MTLREEKRIMRIYTGVAEPSGRNRVFVTTESGRRTELVHRRVHSPDGFAWGYSGNGPADLAHSILTIEIGEEATAAIAARFRDDVVAKLPQHESFELSSTLVWDWIVANRRLVEIELFETPPSSPAASVVGDSPLAPSNGEAAVTPATASAVVAACEAAWSDIQRHHPELPDAVVILGTGVERGRLVKLGHWWGGRWVADGKARAEVLLAGEALHLPPAQVFEVLLHESAHGLNAARGVKDTSRGGRYHNQRFKAAAEEVLLRIRAMPPYGLASTLLTPAALERYDDTIARLGEAMRIARQLERGIRVGAESGAEQQDGRGAAEENGKRSGPPTAACGCGRKMRMAPSVLAAGPVVCGLCETGFSVGVEREHGVSTGGTRLELTPNQRAGHEGGAKAVEVDRVMASVNRLLREGLTENVEAAASRDVPTRET
jgi:hypothetical protein